MGNGKGNKPRRFNQYDNNKAVSELYDKMISNYLKTVRVECGITQPELADRMGVSKYYINKIENCKYPSVSYMRYFPRVLKWLQCCGVQFQLGYIPIVDPENVATAEHYRNGGKRGLKVKKDNQYKAEGDK